MAKSAVKNPRFYAGTPLEKRRVLAVDSVTWKSQQPGTFDSNGLASVCATDAVDVKFIFLEDQDTATSTSYVWVGIIPDGAQFIGYLSSDDADTAATRAMIGDQYGIHVGSNVATVNSNETSNVCVVVKDIAWVAEAFKNAEADDPGQVIFEYLTSVREV